MTDRSSRRDFIVKSGGCVAYLSATFAASGPRALAAWATPRRRTIAQEPWGRLEEVGRGLWSLISTPLSGDFTTVSNGGIIDGRSGVVIVEGTASEEGARWMAERARALTGRWPTHVLVTHHHGDHAAGVGGFENGGETPTLRTTAATQARVTRGIDADAEPGRARPWADVELVGVERRTEIDLGDRSVIVRPYDGHTESDVIVDMPEDDVTWCGDLVWNGMFPNYVDATPSRLSTSVRSIAADGRSTYVPGHGPLATPDDLTTYVRILDHVEAAAREAVARGQTAEEAGANYALPESVGEWTLFNPGYFTRALGAWMTELEGSV